MMRDDCVQPWPKILVIDDNPSNLALCCATLEDEGYTALSASNGHSGLAAFEAHQPDCVLLDVRMPDLDGLTVCRRLRAMPAGHDIPIIILTALHDLDTFDNALLAGCDDYLTKPVRPTDLLKHVRAALKVRHLSAQLREHCAQLREQRDELMRLHLQKERLMSFVVHDLKNPVNSMDLHAQLLLRNRMLPEAARESVQHIREEARTLLRLLLNLLDISKSEEGQLVPSTAPIDLLALVHSVVDAAEVTARCRGVTLVHDLTVTSLVADPDLLRRVLDNLIDNALRHAPPGSTVRITTRRIDLSSVELRVIDAGPGIEARLRERVFERFLQLEHGDRSLPSAGRGLGLTFCKLAISAHGGSIRVEDAAPGAAFCIELPVGPVSHQALPALA